MNKEILHQADKLIDKDGLYDTFMDDIKIFKTSTYTPANPLIYDMWIILVLQSRKIVKLDSNIFEYNSKNYLFSSSTLPFDCETFASEEEPFICLIVSVDKKIMNNMIGAISEERQKIPKKDELGVFSDVITPEIEDITLRLLKTLQSKNDSKVLGQALIKELYYRVASGDNSHFLHQMFTQASNEAKIARTLQKIHDNYSAHLDIEHLAKDEDMSRSSFHTHFKSITSHTPIQYIKKIRLSKAKDLIALSNYNVKECAQEVGYESISQFSRDFKSHFGYPPKEAKPSFDIHSLT